jgi:excinuclease UvrABC ATPase subunit
LGETLQFQPQLLVPDGSKSVKKGALKPWRLGSKQMIIKRNALLKQLAEQLPFDADLPWDELSADVREQLIHGTGDRLFSFKLKGGSTKPEMVPFEGVLGGSGKDSPQHQQRWLARTADGVPNESSLRAVPRASLARREFERTRRGLRDY